MADPTPLAQLQQTICTHLRDPQRAPAPSQIPLQRLALYRELVRTNFVEQLGGAFPVLQQSCDDDYWERLLDDFLADHRCRSPLFHQLPQEFVDYLQHERTAAAGDPPWLAELAHYEWMELALAQHEAELPPADTTGDPLRRGFPPSPPRPVPGRQPTPRSPPRTAAGPTRAGVTPAASAASAALRAAPPRRAASPTCSSSTANPAACANAATT